MPTYEYICGKCGHEFEKFQSITAKSIRKCPKCGKSQVKRKIGTGGGLIFKGGGFYITDYRSEAYKNAAKSDAAAAPSTAAASESSKTDAKPGKSAESKPAEKESKSKESKPASDGKSSAKSEAKPSKPAQ